MAQSVSAGNQTYHHGDLRTALVDAASQRIEREGIAALSLRKLADDIGVSRSALYHHFRDKNALLNAVAARGFDQWLSMTQDRDQAQNIKAHERLKQFVHGYIRWAIAHPQLYDIMFGRPIWKHKLADEELKEIAFPAFQYMLNLISDWQQQGLLLQNEPALRQTQVIWATLHGLAKLIIDGVYDDSAHIDDMCNCAVAMLLSQHRET
ncbi:MAG: TetR/AcrR family transcriptional regulator [Alteromonadaceae bacterium]|nr:TetR/AcrR family transcriptional regulator [Alteromonadaceae bacterium]